MTEVTDINQYRSWKDEDRQIAFEEMEEEILVSMAASIDGFVDRMSEHYDVEPALICEHIVGAILGRAGLVVRSLDDPSFKDLINYIHELSGESLDDLGIRKGRDEEERQEWRQSVYRHRLD